MIARRRMGPTSARAPLWFADARERLRALLPELVVCIVAVTCMTAVTLHHDGDSVPTLVASTAAIQLVLQPVLYACVYLISAEWGLVAPFVLMTMAVPIFTVVLSALGLNIPIEQSLDLSVSVAMASVVFCLTRPRAGILSLFLEVLVLSTAVNEIPDMWVWVTHVIGFVALLTLMVMRFSATRITRDFVPDEGLVGTEGEGDDEGDRAPAPGMYGQVALLGILVGALCLAAALGSLSLMAWRSDTAATTAQTQGEEYQEQSFEARPFEAQPVDGLPVEGLTDGGSATSEHVQGIASDGAGGRALARLLAISLLLALPVLPFIVRMLLRHLVRRSIEREPNAADRAARLYVGIRDRLEAAGIERDETLTPREFLILYEEELEGLTAAAGIDGAAWDVITDAYEQARYAGLAPDDPALELCWRAYDALPGCAQAAVGWRRYLAGPFWRM